MDQRLVNDSMRLPGMGDLGGSPLRAPRRGGSGLRGGHPRGAAGGRAAVGERVAPEADQVYNLGAMRVPATGLPISKPQLVIERHL